MTLKWFLTINNNVKKCIKETKCSVPKSHLTVYDPMDCSPSDSSVHGDSPGKKTRVSCLSLLQGNLSYLEIKLMSPVSPTLAGKFFTELTGKT